MHPEPVNRGRRSSLIFLTGTFLAAGIALSLDRVGQLWIRQENQVFRTGQRDMLFPLSKRALTQEDWSAAARAWQYISQNTRANTGLVDSVAGFPSTTLWDQGSYIFALLAALKLELIPRAEAEARAQVFLHSLRGMPLFDGKLPNKAYDTRSLQMTNYANQSAPLGIGWSALDLCRLLVALRSVAQTFPNLQGDLRLALARWDMRALANKGELWGATGPAGNEKIWQEGRLGYEQYGARAAALWGLDVAAAMSATRHLEWVRISGVQVPSDRRRSDVFGAITPILSEPYLLQAMEMGLNRESEILAHQIYAAQEARFNRLGIPTMVSEDHLDEAPSFAYASVYANGRAWAVVGEDGKFYDHLRTLSTKAIFGWDALYETPYTSELRARIARLPDEGKGWQAGIYEQDPRVNSVYTLNTNAVVLEALHFKAFGAFLGG